MSRGINKVILIGNLGQDPEMRFMPNGHAVANVSLATGESWKDKKTGEMMEHTEWHRVVFFRRLAEIVGEHLKKGSQVYIEGRLKTSKWQDEHGNDRYNTAIIVTKMKMLGSSNAGKPPVSSGSGGDVPTDTPSSLAESGVFDDADWDDDIPF